LAVLTENEPLTSTAAFGPNITPLGLMKKKFAPEMSERIVPLIEEGLPPVTRLRIF